MVATREGPEVVEVAVAVPHQIPEKDLANPRAVADQNLLGPGFPVVSAAAALHQKKILSM